jgi:hypothetical protein
MKKAVLIAGVYLAITSFLITGNPWAAQKTITMPIFGILLTLPWSLIVGRFTPSLTIGLETAAVLNAALMILIIRRSS